MPVRQWSLSLLAGAWVLATPAFCQADDAGEGRGIYHDLCAACHGKDMLNPGLAFDLRKFPKNDPERFRHSVLNGKGQVMPAWKDQLSVEDVNALWAYVKDGS